MRFLVGVISVVMVKMPGIIVGDHAWGVATFVGMSVPVLIRVHNRCHFGQSVRACLPHR